MLIHRRVHPPAAFHALLGSHQRSVVPLTSFQEVVIEGIFFKILCRNRLPNIENERIVPTARQQSIDVVKRW